MKVWNLNGVKFQFYRVSLSTEDSLSYTERVSLPGIYDQGVDTLLRLKFWMPEKRDAVVETDVLYAFLVLKILIQIIQWLEFIHRVVNLATCFDPTDIHPSNPDLPGLTETLSGHMRSSLAYTDKAQQAVEAYNILGMRFKTYCGSLKSITKFVCQEEANCRSEYMIFSFVYSWLYLISILLGLQTL